MNKVIIIISFMIFLFLIKKNKESFKNNYKSYFINLDRDNKRRNYMKKQFRENNIKCQRFKAFDKNLLNKKKIEEMKNNNILDLNYKPKIHKLGSIACLVSHTNLYKKIYRENKGGIFLIFEDDCKILPGFNKKIEYYLDRLPQDWDMIWLGYNNIKGKKYNKDFYIPNEGYHIGYNSQHHCYLLNYKFIPKLLGILLPIKENFITKDQILRINFSKFNAYFCKERLAIQDMKEFPFSERTGGRNG